MSVRSLLIVILLGLLCINVSFAAPGVRFGPTPTWVISVKPNEQKPNLRDINDGYFLQLYEKEVNVGSDEVYHHVIKEIVSDAGIQAASNLSVDFNPLYEQLTVHQVTVWRDGRPLDKLQKDAFKVVASEEQLSRFIYNGNYTAYLIVKDIRKGDKIEFAYTVSGSNPIFNKKFFTSFIFMGSDPISQIHYSLLVPASHVLNFKYFNTTDRPVVSATNNVQIYDWNLVNEKGAENTSKTPSWFNPYPYVQISEYKNWAEVSDWAYRINIPEDKVNGTLAKRVAELKDKHGNDTASFIRSIVSLVQNEVRYMGVELGEYSHRANKPEKVYEQRYGDCKDKSLLLVSMLRSAGFSADMALVNSGNKKIEGDLPSPMSFNHAIVCAHLPEKDIWIDPTIACQGGISTDFYCPDYGKALLLAPGNSELKIIEEVPSGTIKYTEHYEISDVTKPASLTVYTYYTLNKADEIRSTLANESKSDLEKSYLEYYLKLYPNIESADTITINDDKKFNVIETIEHYTIRDFMEYDSAHHNYPVSFYVQMIKNLLPDVGNKKIYPIAVSYPYNVHYSIRVTAPITWNVEHDKGEISGNAYRYSYDFAADSNTLLLQHEFTFLKDHIAPDEIAQYEKDSKKIINDHLSYSFTYTPGGTNLHTGTNYWAIVLLIVLVAGSIYAGTKIYKAKTPNRLSLHYEPKAMGGWLVLPLLGLIASTIRCTYYVATTGFFSNAIWHVYDSQSVAFQFKALLWMEFSYNVLVVCLSLFCLLLMYKKRNILPKYIKLLYIISVIVVVADSVCAYQLFPSMAVDYKNIFRTIVSACIWIPYFTTSFRVKETFVVPYEYDGYELPQVVQDDPKF